ncbi:hypothetical protein ACJ73_09861 [Blastomyces percursus]|uniref:GmrSD restriction endonucleases C-terminal domain-containing protein n=1 Tax=Blastomyces percursus TaxID=1658174 RepID=A0A1J9P254_9EURO|nr:hypothetical protein ACJ73_09861 [Blastomyces percursus]
MMGHHTTFLLLLLAALTTLTTSSTIPLHKRSPPNIPSSTEAQGLLGSLIVAPRGSHDGYSRKRFPHWITIKGACNTRETVLKRDGMNVEVGPNCQPTSGMWYSPYDGATWSDPSDVDVDHVVPLSLAWKSGASSWTKNMRQKFANDLRNPQLIAVTDKVNQAKGDKGPDEWKPPSVSYHCEYSRMWIKVKSTYNLTVTEAEMSALKDMLRTC